MNHDDLRDRLEASGDLRGLVYNFCLFVDNRLPATEHVSICHFIESNVLRVAERGQYSAVITNNTNPVTQVTYYDCLPALSANHSPDTPRVGPEHPSSPLSIYFLIFSLFTFPFLSLALSIFFFVHPFPFYHNSPTPFPGRRS